MSSVINTIVSSQSKDLHFQSSTQLCNLRWLFRHLQKGPEQGQSFCNRLPKAITDLNKYMIGTPISG